MKKIKIWMGSLFLLLCLAMGAVTVQAAVRAPGKTTLVSAKALSYESVKVIWESVKGADGYRVYYRVNEKWVRVGSTQGTTFTHVSSDKKPLVPGKTYKYTVRAYKKSGDELVLGAFDKKGVEAKVPVPKLSAVKGLSASSVVYDQMKISWKKVSGAEYYRVYVKVNQKWVRLGTTSKTSFVHKNQTKAPLTAGKKYQYRVRAFVYTGGKMFWGTDDQTGITAKYDPPEKTTEVSTGNSDPRVRSAAQAVIAKVTNSGMTQYQKLNACFSYVMISNFVPNDNPDRTQANWQYNCAYKYLTTHSGSCHGFAFGFAAMAKELGYSPVVISIPHVHAFVQINGKYWDTMYGGQRGVDTPLFEYSSQHVTVF